MHSSRSCWSDMRVPSSSWAWRSIESRSPVSAAPLVAALLDHAVDDRVELRDGALEAAPLRRRQPLRRKGRKSSSGSETTASTASIASPDVVGVLADLGAEERLGDDLERQAHHVLVDVAHLAVAPLGGEARRVVDHDVAVGRDAIAMERRLRQAPLPPPEVALAR